MWNWLQILQRVYDSLYQYVETTEGKVGRLEKANENNYTISFGSFVNGIWKIKSKVNISERSIKSYISKSQCKQRLKVITKNYNAPHF